jgi:glycosyltransferase involved in cell wall biosynthesis
MFILVLTNIKSGHGQKIVRGLIHKGHRVEVVSYEKMETPGIKVHTLGANFFLHRYMWYIFAGLMLRKFVKRLSPDIIFVIYLAGYGIMGSITNFHPLVLMSIGSDVSVNMNRSHLIRGIIRRLLRNANGFITVAGHIADCLVKEGIDPGRIIICPIGVDLNVFYLSQYKEKGLIVSTRPLEPLYNVKQLVEACPILFKNQPKVRVVIIGDGKQRKYLENKVSGYQEKVCFTGRVSRLRLVDILKRAQIFVSMATSDGAPVSLFEAMACGCFPVVSDIPANRAWIKDGVNGFIVPLGDPELLARRISEANESPDLLRRAQLENAKIVKEKLNINYTIEHIEKYLKSFLDK